MAPEGPMRRERIAPTGETNLRRERQLEGIADAKARGSLAAAHSHVSISIDMGSAPFRLKRGEARSPHAGAAAGGRQYRVVAFDIGALREVGLRGAGKGGPAAHIGR